MKIAILAQTFLPKASGAEIFHHNLATRLTARGHSVTVIIPRKTARALAEKNWDLPYAIDTVPGNTWSWFKRSPRMARWWSGRQFSKLQRRHRFDVWHGVMLVPTGIALIPWAVRRRIPHVIRSAGDDMIRGRGGQQGLRANPRIDALARREAPRAAAVVALSQTIFSAFEHHGLHEDRIHLIPNAVDLERFAVTVDRNAERTNLGLVADRFTFLAVGRNHPQKNYTSLLKAALRLTKDGHRFQLLIAGRDAAQLEKTAAEMGIPDVVRGVEITAETDGPPQFPPDALIRAYRCADAFVMPSLLEGFSSALLEAMAAGLPVLTSDAPGCRDFVRDGKDALIVRPTDVDALADRMRDLMTDASLRADLTKRSLARAAEFSWDSVVTRYEDLYELLRAKPTATR